MPAYGIIGYPLSHSFSPSFFREKFNKEGLQNHSYIAWPLENIGQIFSLLSNADIKGLNVTLPYKKAVVPLLYSADSVVKEIGSCNCISIDNGILSGYNTDVIGFEKSLLPLLQSYHSHALILGTGGAASAVQYVLRKLHIDFISASRNEKHENVIGYDQVTLAMLDKYKLVINTTPLGMYPNEEMCPRIPYQHLTPQHLLFDLVYNPAETVFLKKGKDCGANIKNGYEMLMIQAEESWKIWKSYEL